MKRRLGQRGFSLAEVLTSTLFVSILTAMSYTFARGALMNARLQDAQSDAQESAMMAVDVLTREVRMAGFSAAGTPLTGLLDAGAERVQIAADLNGNGNTADADELIAYAYNGAKQQLTRATGGGSPQPFVRDVPAGGVHFSFFDAGGHELQPAAGTAGAAQRASVRRIDAVLTVELPNPDPTVPHPLRSTSATSIALRNP
jgi:type II secretory pathway component PulJ